MTAGGGGKFGVGVPLRTGILGHSDTNLPNPSLKSTHGDPPSNQSFAYYCRCKVRIRRNRFIHSPLQNTVLRRNKPKFKKSLE